MAWDRATKARHLLRRYEAAVVASQDASDAYACIPFEAHISHPEEVTAAIEAKHNAERKLNEVRGRVYRALVNSTEDL